MDAETPCRRAEEAEECVVNEGQEEDVVGEVNEIGSMAGYLGYVMICF